MMDDKKEIFNKNSKKRIMELETRYDVESRLKEAETIRKKNRELAEANSELREALNEVKTMSVLLPICASCKKIGTDQVVYF